MTDQLGTPRMIFDKSGSLAATKRHDYLPFGEELFATQGARTTALGYGPLRSGPADKVRQQFTLYERDNETGLDYAQARYHSNIAGRFTSPDPYLGSAYLAAPQSWNRYTYCLNNPVNLIDPSGLRWLTKDHEAFQWVADDKYKAEEWEGYDTVEAGTIAFFGEWGGYPERYKGLMGGYVTLNADGSLGDAGIRTSDDNASAQQESAGGGFGVGVTGNVAAAILIIVLIGVAAVGSRQSGWRVLAKMYRFPNQFHGKRWSFLSARMGLESARPLLGLRRSLFPLRACLNVGVDRNGIYPSLFPLFRFLHPPLFIPWDHVSAVSKESFFQKQVEFRFREAPSVVLRLNESIAQEILMSGPASKPHLEL